MFGNWQRMRIIGTAILFSFSQLSASAKEPAMNNVTTLCFGRFLLDLPAGAHIRDIGQQSQFMYGELRSEAFPTGVDGFKEKMATRELYARNGENPKDYKFERVVHTSVPNTRIFVTSDDIFGQKLFRFEMYHWIDGFLFSLAQGPYEEEKIGPNVQGLETDVVARLRVRAHDEIPAEAGFCIKDGFIADDGIGKHFEEARMQINFKEWPDVWISIYSQTVPKGGEQTLLQRIASHPYTGIYATLARQIKTLRKGVHNINGFKGEEILEVFPTDNGFKQHSFRWETLGAVKSIFAPSIVLEFESGTPLEGEPRPPTLTDDQAVKLYDSIVNSIRLRPTTAPAKSSANELPKKPLGEQTITGRICPQTGWWQTDDVGVVTDWRRRHFKEGERLPSALRYLEPSLWQKIKGERPVGQSAVLWKLVEYGGAPQLAKQGLPPQEAGQVKDAEPPTDG